MGLHKNTRSPFHKVNSIPYGKCMVGSFYETDPWNRWVAVLLFFSNEGVIKLILGKRKVFEHLCRYNHESQHFSAK